MKYSNEVPTNELLAILQVKLAAVEKQLLSAESNCTTLRFERSSLQHAISTVSETGRAPRG